MRVSVSIALKDHSLMLLRNESMFSGRSDKLAKQTEEAATLNGMASSYRSKIKNLVHETRSDLALLDFVLEDRIDVLVFNFNGKSTSVSMAMLYAVMMYS